MATYISKIKAYVGTDSEVDFINDVIVKDDGNGPYIAEWENQSKAKPTDAQLNALETEAQAIDDDEAASVTSKTNAKASGIAKLKAATWSPLTDDEATALFGE